MNLLFGQEEVGIATKLLVDFGCIDFPTVVQHAKASAFYGLGFLVSTVEILCAKVDLGIRG